MAQEKTPKSPPPPPPPPKQAPKIAPDPNTMVSGRKEQGGGSGQEQRPAIKIIIKKQP